MKERVDNPKPPRRLYTLGDDGTQKEQDIWVCGKCLLLSVGKHTKEEAANCCKKRYCDKCSMPIDDQWYSVSCSSCIYVKKVHKMIIVEYDGGPLCELDGDRYFESMECFVENYKKDELPDFAHPCDVIEWAGLPESCIDDAIENECNELFEDAYDHVSDLKPLYDAVRAWNKKQNLYYWQHRFKEKVKIDAGL